jgi:soluble lytic murein transglycosylase-like protein
VQTADGELAVMTYVAKPANIDHALKPYGWYKAFVVAGAMKHGLPPDYVERIRAVESVADPDRDRAARNRSLIPSPWSST